MDSTSSIAAESYASATARDAAARAVAVEHQGRSGSRRALACGAMESHRPQVRIDIPLRHRDVDELGHVNQAVYHVLLEEVRAAFVRVALPQLPYTGYVLARSELDYRQEIRLEDRFVIGEAHVGALGRSSITIENRLLKPDGQTVAAEGRAIVVAWDAEERRARPLTDDERAILLPDD